MTNLPTMQRSSVRTAMFLTGVGYLAALPYVALADTAQLTNPLGSTDTVCKLIKAVLDVAMQIALPIMVFYLVFAGFKFLTAQGNATKLDAARQNLLHVVIGIGIFLGAYTLAMVVAGTIGELQKATNANPQAAQGAACF